MRRPKLWVAMVLTVGAALAWTVAGLTKTRDLQLLVEAVMFVLLAGAVWSGLNLLVYAAIMWRKGWIDANQAQTLALIQEERALATSLRYMTDEQLNAFGRRRVRMEMVPAPGGPICTLIFPFAEVPFDFVETFMAHGTLTHLAPVRRWGEGSKSHDYAVTLTRYFIDDGFASYEAGNHSAFWLSDQARQAGLESIGFVEEW